MRWINQFVFLAVLAFVLTVPGGLDAQEPAASAKASSQAAINLNTATAAQLEALPGIGPKVAARILEYRQKSGGFKKLEDLMNVQGIGEKNFLKLKPLLVVTPPKGDRENEASR